MDIPGFDGTCIVYVPYGDELPRSLSQPEVDGMIADAGLGPVADSGDAVGE
jgi:hypothetical protein